MAQVHRATGLALVGANPREVAVLASAARKEAARPKAALRRPPTAQAAPSGRAGQADSRSPMALAGGPVERLVAHAARLEAAQAVAHLAVVALQEACRHACRHAETSSPLGAAVAASGFGRASARRPPRLRWRCLRGSRPAAGLAPGCLVAQARQNPRVPPRHH